MGLMTSKRGAELWITCYDGCGNAVRVLTVHRSRTAAQKRAGSSGAIALRVSCWGAVDVVAGELLAVERQTPTAPASYAFKAAM